MNFEINHFIVQIIACGTSIISALTGLFQLWIAVRANANQELDSESRSVVGSILLPLALLGIGGGGAYLAVNPVVVETAAAKVEEVIGPPITGGKRPGGTVGPDHEDAEEPGSTGSPPPPPPPPPPTESELLANLVRPEAIGMPWARFSSQIWPERIVKIDVPPLPSVSFYGHVTLAGCELSVTADEAGFVDRVASSPTTACIVAWKKVIPALESREITDSSITSIMVDYFVKKPQLLAITIKDLIGLSAASKVIGINGELTFDEKRHAPYIELVMTLIDDQDTLKTHLDTPNGHVTPVFIARTRFTDPKHAPLLLAISKRLRQRTIQGRQDNGKCDERYLNKIVQKFGNQDVGELELSRYNPASTCAK